MLSVTVPMGLVTLITGWHVQETSEGSGGVPAHTCPWLRAESRINRDPGGDQLELVT